MVEIDRIFKELDKLDPKEIITSKMLKDVIIKAQLTVEEKKEFNQYELFHSEF